MRGPSVRRRSGGHQLSPDSTCSGSKYANINRVISRSAANADLYRQLPDALFVLQVTVSSAPRLDAQADSSLVKLPYRGQPVKLNPQPPAPASRWDDAAPTGTTYHPARLSMPTATPTGC